jgi:hypothetical protein
MDLDFTQFEKTVMKSHVTVQVYQVCELLSNL